MGISKNYLCSGTSRILCGLALKKISETTFLKIALYYSMEYDEAPAYFEGLAKVRKGNRARGK